MMPLGRMAPALVVLGIAFPLPCRADDKPSARPVKVEEIPEKTYHDDLRGIVGFEVVIDEIQAD